jgi:hypothetical protein
MAALVAGQHNPQLRAFRQRLIDQGKKPLVALVAVMRKLIVIVIANAVLRDADAIRGDRRRRRACVLDRCEHAATMTRLGRTSAASQVG